MKHHLVGTTAVLLTMGVLALAQTRPQTEKQKPAEKPRQTSSQAQPGPKPGPEHQALGFFAGKWKSEGEMKPGPMGPGGRMTSTDSCDWFNGRFHLVCRGEGQGPMGRMTSMGVMTYSAGEKAYTYYGIDSMGSSELARGNRDGKTWTYTAKSAYGGQTFESRYTIVETGPDAYTFKWETSPDGTTWSTMFEGKATRLGKATS